MKIKERAVLHNRFDVSVVDAASGKVKQTAVGFNVITDYYFNSRLTGSPMTIGSDLLTYISIGTGSGTPAVTDTALFTHLTRKAVTTLETVYAYPKADMPYMVNCAYCGKEIQMRRKGERKYCSHRCYIAARYKDGGGND